MRRAFYSKEMIFIFVLNSVLVSVFSQNNRISLRESIGWYSCFATFNFGNKFGLHTEYQFRRYNIITHWQQSLLRLGVNYMMKPSVLFRVGYAWVETFNFGEIPLNAAGKTTTEHRIFEVVQLTHKEKRLEFTHRYMLEQRFAGRYSSPELTREDTYNLLHRIRYLVRLQVPLKGREIADKTPYVNLFDEIFIGFGKHVGANIFDQNRIGLLLGFRFNKSIRMEGGYLNQIFQFSRLIDGKNVFQHNHGIIISVNFTINLLKNKYQNHALKESVVQPSL